MTTGTIAVQKDDDATITLALTNADGSAYTAGGNLTLTVVRQAGLPALITKSQPATASAGMTFTETDLDQPVHGNRRASGRNAFYVTENHGQPGTVGVVIGIATVARLLVLALSARAAA